MISPSTIIVLQTVLASLFFIFAVQLCLLPNANWRRTTLAVAAAVQGGMIMGLYLFGGTDYAGQYTVVGLAFFMLLLVNMTHNLIVRGIPKGSSDG